jgi:hypothetical protein
MKTTFVIVLSLLLVAPEMASATCYGYAGPGGPCYAGPGGGGYAGPGGPGYAGPGGMGGVSPNCR